CGRSEVEVVSPTPIYW
nr:immunoglobulin heavy chain junction region [Macaca mulatta]